MRGGDGVADPGRLPLPREMLAEKRRDLVRVALDLAEDDDVGLDRDELPQEAGLQGGCEEVVSVDVIGDDAEVVRLLANDGDHGLGGEGAHAQRICHITLVRQPIFTLVHEQEETNGRAVEERAAVATQRRFRDSQI